MSDVEIGKLVQEFADSILKQREAVGSGTVRQVRYYGNKIMPIAKKLLSMGDEGKRQFATLLQHSDREVRGTAAVYLCSTMPEEALSVFRELTKSGNDEDDLIALGAKMRIKEWEEHPENYDQSHWV